ncbi:hypothetical protein SXANM310S_00022 [Streptomyces xanthochromogenes]
MVLVKTLIALPVFYVVSRAPQIAGLLVGLGLMTALSRAVGSGQGVSVWTGLMILVVSLLGVLAVGLACMLPSLRMAGGGRRAVVDVCWESADRVAAWAGWETSEPHDQE